MKTLCVVLAAILSASCATTPAIQSSQAASVPPPAPAKEVIPSDLLGSWRGAWKIRMTETGLDVLRIAPDGIDTIYYWGDDASRRQMRGIQRAGKSKKKGHLIAPNQIEIFLVDPAGNKTRKVTYTLQADGKTLVAKLELPSGDWPTTDYAILHRVSPAPTSQK